MFITTVCALFLIQQLIYLFEKKKKFQISGIVK